MTSFDELDAEMARLKAMTGGGSSLEPVLPGEPDVENPEILIPWSCRGDVSTSTKGPENTEIRS